MSEPAQHNCNDEGLDILKIDQGWCLIFDFNDYDEISIKYCPYCGLKLEA